jgi:hypothetical protein
MPQAGIIRHFDAVFKNQAVTLRHFGQSHDFLSANGTQIFA